MKYMPAHPGPSPFFDVGRWLTGAIVALLLFRLWFAIALPMTGDEAYFIVWGLHPAGGYYDHPPMVGWWLTALLAIGRSAWWLRLPAVMLPFLLAWGMWWLVRQAGEKVGGGEGGDERALFAALLTLLLPANVWNVLITTDTPVVFFCFLSVLAYVRGQRDVSPGWHLLAGLLLGMGFLGKYFAALLGLAFAAHVVFVRRDRGRWLQLSLLTAAALVGPAYNLWWNSSHCWSNILFNFINRTEDAGFSWRNPLSFFVSLAYLATPWVLWAMWRGRATVVAANNATVRAAGWLAGVPLLGFLLLSFGKPVGLHWLLAFVPLLVVPVAVVLPLPVLHTVVRWLAAFAVLHMIAVLIFLNLPLSLWKDSSLHAGMVFTIRADVIERQLREPVARCGEGCVMAMESYSSAATLAYALDRPVVVFGDGSFHGRQDDFDTDFRALDGRDFLLLRKETVRLESYAPFFERVDVSSFEIDGVLFHTVHGQGFKYPVYHERMLTRVRDRYYRIPEWLPARGCAFTERYFSGEAR
ncbi:MAG: glycosyltransferase family 39 protein [Betaproteobacteria bacterium]|uniref:Glycosyltransferase family 39 protein n=1 Tax=Candidatus Proximibacter danicus TaxID=2954365 RepID=A0A9D7K3M1_9PROT|nr:glycosyltransferase family 39 protein [Candidatus Proximibacter danicus]